MNTNLTILTADIGGSWIKLARFAGDHLTPASSSRIANPCREGRDAGFGDELRQALAELLGGEQPDGIGISTAGIVDYAGRRLTAGHAYLDPLKAPHFLTDIEHIFGCPAVMINDADAALIGAAQAGYFHGAGCHGLLALGTGCGFALWKNGQRWRPDRQLPLLGSLRTPAGSYDQLCSATALASRSGEGRLEWIFTEASYRPLLDQYLGNLACLIDNAALIYQCESVLLAGGLVAAALEVGFDLAAALQARLMPAADYHRPPVVTLAREGNDLPLLGVRALVRGEAMIAGARARPDFQHLATEAAGPSGLRLENCTPSELIELCLRNENSVAHNWSRQAAALTACATRLAATFQQGGRLIYLGCGTSGRLAALDALELNCTFGLPKHQALALISGGIAEAAASIEENFEEDASAVPEMLLLNPGPLDVVIGISASGSAWFVRSGLAFAHSVGSFCVLISASAPEEGFCNLHVNLETGPELVTGSTRMKAGTATKKILNSITTTALILCGKVAGTHMIDVACLNEKLVERACGILHSLHGLPREDALALLRQHDMRLSLVLQSLSKISRMEITEPYKVF